MEDSKETQQETVQECLQKAPEQPTIDDSVHYDELVQTNGQIAPMAFNYKVIHDGNTAFVTVIAPNGSSARDGLNHHFYGGSFSYLNKSDIIIQVQ